MNCAHIVYYDVTAQTWNNFRNLNNSTQRDGLKKKRL